MKVMSVYMSRHSNIRNGNKTRIKGVCVGMIGLNKYTFIIVSIILLLSLATMPVTVAETPLAEGETGGDVDTILGAGAYVDESPISSEAAIVMDYTTGLVIYEFNADELRVPASMTKMIAVYVVFDAIRDGIVSLDTVIGFSEETSIFSYNRAYSNVPMPLDSSYTLSELLDVVIVRSASAATIALGEGLFGSEEALVAKMNEKVNSLGIEASFHDSWGGSPDNRISARGMALLTRELLKEYPGVLYFSSKASVIFDDVEYRSTNLLLGDYESVDGLKTGFTNPAGWCFTGTAIMDERRIISVTMGSVQGYRFPDSAVLLEYGFANYNITIASHFRGSLHSIDIFQSIRSPLVPITMFNLEEAHSLGIRELAIILNHTEKRD